MYSQKIIVLLALTGATASAEGYNAENLPPVKPPHESPQKNIMGEHARSFLQAFTGRQNASGEGFHKLVSERKTPHIQTYYYEAWTKQESPSGDVAQKTRQALANQLRSDSQSVLKEQTVTNTSWFQELSGGFDFSFDLGSFGGTSTTASARPAPLKYGLVADRIELDSNAPNIAALTEMNDLSSAASAEVKWRIAPKEAKQSISRPGSIRADQDDYQRKVHPLLRPVSGKFKTRVQPELQVSESAAKEQPGFQIDMLQEQQYYGLKHHTKAAEDRETTEHAFKIPVSEKVFVHRTYGEAWYLIKMGAVYSDPDLSHKPRVEVTKLEKENLIETKYGQDMYEGRLELGTKLHDDPAKKEYTVGYNKSF